MKRVYVFCLAVLVLFSALPFDGHAKEARKRGPKILIFGSILGAMADPVQWTEFSCINPDGTLNSQKYEMYMSVFSRNGANATRELPFLMEEQWKVYKDNSYMPFLYTDNGYDLNRFNPTYFQNLRRMCELANAYGMRFYLSLFDRCHGLMAHSPWKHNLQNINGWDDAKAGKYRKAWVHKVLDTLKGLVFGFELANEPRRDGFYSVAVETLEILRNRYGIPMRHIITGVEHLPPENPFFRGFKKALRKAKFYKKKDQFSVMHQVREEKLKEYRHIQKHSRRWFISDDGNHPKWSVEQWANSLTEFFRYKRPRRNKAFMNQWAFEHVYRFTHDDINGCLGIAIALENVTGIRMYNAGEVDQELVSRYVKYREEPVQKGSWFTRLLKFLWDFLRAHVKVKIEWVD